MSWKPGPVPEHQLRAQEKYDKAHTTHVSMKLNNKTDKDILDWLSSQDCKQQAIKDAIRTVLKSGED